MKLERWQIASLGFGLVLVIAAAVILLRDREPAGTSLLFPDDTAVVALGREVYDAHCASCHGAELEGQPNWRARRPDGLLPAPPHDASGHTWHHPGRWLIEMTKYGPRAFAGPDYRSEMPAFDGILSDAEIVAVLSFIKSTWPPEIRRRHDDLEARAAGS